MKPGDTVYDLMGEEYELLAEVPRIGYVVQALYESEDGPRCAGEPQFAERVFSEPPTPRKQAEVAELQEKLDFVRGQIREARQELAEAEKNRERSVTKVASQNAALTRIADFLDGKITHYVVEQYGGIKIVPLSEATCDSESAYRNRNLKLLTLFGNTNGDLHWGLNSYKDGSGSNCDCYPCCSFEEAKELAACLITERVDAWRIDPANIYQLHHLPDAADSIGIGLPADVLAALDKNRRDENERAAAKLEKQLAEVRAKLAPPH